MTIIFLKKKKQMFNLATILKRPLILDGAMGSLLEKKGISPHHKLWFTNSVIDNPEEVLAVHKAYIGAGADIITTNTFRSNPEAVKGTRCKSSELVKEAVKLAKEAKGKTKTLIAGSNAPAEDCYQIERKISKAALEKNHKQHLDLLFENEVSFILNETFSHLDEILLVSKYCHENKFPFIVSLFAKDRNTAILSGESLTEVIDKIKEFSPLAIGFNCIRFNTLKYIYPIISHDLNWGFYLNCGKSKISSKKITSEITADEYAKEISAYFDKRPFFVGACCGSSPEHIKSVRKIFS